MGELLVRILDPILSADAEQSHLVVASGASNTNSLRVVRSGVGLEEVSCVEGIEDVVNMWSLSSIDG